MSRFRGVLTQAGGQRMNSTERRFWRRLPGGLKAILAGLPPAAVESFEAFGWSWRARVRCAGRRQGVW
jgi:hypothetical protein